jgi:hypothetical protein
MSNTSLADLPCQPESIKSRLDYRTKKLHKEIGHQSNAGKDPFALLLSQLSGIKPRPPKQLQAEQHWSKSHFDTDIKDVFETRWATSGKGKKDRTAFRATVTRDLFRALEPEVQKSHAKAAKAEHEAATLAWKESLSSPPSTDPRARQE